MANPQSRNEEILQSIVDDTEYTKVPQSREEYLLLEIKDIIGQGGGGTSNVQGLVLTMNSSTYVVTAYLIDGEGQRVGEAQTIDIPLEATIVDASYNNTTKTITFTLTSGAYLSVPIGDIIYGLQPLIDSTHKLSSSLVDDTQSRLKFIWSGTTAQFAIDGPNLPAGTPYIITDDQDIDTVPTQNSTNPITSGGVYNSLARLDPLTGDVYFGSTRVARVMDSDSYAALTTKDNIYYLTYPTPAVNANVNSQRSEAPEIIEDEMRTEPEEEPIEPPNDDDMR